jgi:hypothetical protein
MAEHLLPLAKIRVDGGTQHRLEISLERVSRYAEDMKDGDKFPPATVFFDGTDHWMGDGHSRHAAAGLAGRKTLAVKVRKGTREDAVRFAATCNHGQGEDYTRADRRNAAKNVLLLDLKQSDSSVAKQCKVSRGLVASVREDIDKEKPAESQDAKSTSSGQDAKSTSSSERTGSDGKTYPATKPDFQCRQCRLFGPQKGCQDCKAGRQSQREKAKKDAAKPREPGDETQAETQRKKDRASNGKPLVNWKNYEKAFGVVARMPDSIKSVYKDEKMSKEFVRAGELLTEFAEVMVDWKKRLQKVKEKV